MNWQGALAGILSGGRPSSSGKNMIKPYFNLYELLPAFIVSFLFILVVSSLTAKPSAEIEAEYDKFIQSDL
jgi:sodium/proline symporter